MKRFCIPKCVLCDLDAVTTAAHVPVCEEHHEAYQKEAKKYLPGNQRPIYASLMQAALKELREIWE
jgi:hypothetical protein